MSAHARRLDNARRRLQRRANAIVDGRARGVELGDLGAAGFGHLTSDVRVARQVHVGAEQTRRVDADVAASQIANRSHRETGRGDEHECQRHLDGHERRKRQRAEPPLCRGVGP